MLYELVTRTLQAQGGMPSTSFGRMRHGIEPATRRRRRPQVRLLS